MDCEDKHNIRPLADANRHAFATQELAFYNATRLLSRPNPCALEGPKLCFEDLERAFWKTQRAGNEAKERMNTPFQELFARLRKTVFE